MAIRSKRAPVATLLSLAAWGIVLVGGQSASADFKFNPTGDGLVADTYSISGLGFGGGNVLAQNSIPLSVGATFTVYFQTHLTSLTGPNAPAAVPGLNSTFQITEVAILTEQVTSLTTTAAGTTATFGLVAGNPNNQLSIYYNPAVVFNDSAGTGFTAGTKIATLTPTGFTSSSFTDATAGGGKPTVTFNQTSSGTYSGVTADQGTGATGLNMAVPAASYNPAFFQPPAGTPTLVSSLLNLNLSSVFDSVAPSLLFTNPITSATVTPHIGTNSAPSNNGTSPTDEMLQSSGFTQSFTPVPEPTSLALTGLGLGGVLALARRRRARAS